MLKDNTFFTVQSFMVTKLGLSGNDLLVYAIIYGFSQDSASVFSGSRKYLAEWCNATERGIQKNLNYLMERNLIEQVTHSSDNRTVCYKVTNLFTSEQSSPVLGNKVHYPSEQSSPAIDNIDNNIAIDNIVRPYTNVYGDSNESAIETPTENIQEPEVYPSRRKRLFDTDDTVESKPKKKGNLFERCVEEAKNRYHDELLTVVLEYLNYRIKSKQHGFGFQAWVNLLNKLDALADFDQEKVRIVEQSLQMKWDTFAELRTWGKKTGCERFGETEDMRSGVPVGEVLNIQF